MGSDDNSTSLVRIDPKLPELLETEVVRKTYKDLASSPLKELGKLSAQAIRLLGMPLRLSLHYAERLETFVKRAQEKVPNERQVPALPEVAGPVIENVKYLSDGNPLWSLYEELLARAIDKDRQAEAHPAFAGLIAQLSPDEAIILKFITETGDAHLAWEYESKEPAYAQAFPKENLREVERSLPPIHQPRFWRMYIGHLRHLGLVETKTEFPNRPPDPFYSRDYREKSFTVRQVERQVLTQFGSLFVAACIAPSQSSVETAPPAQPSSTKKRKGTR